MEAKVQWDQERAGQWFLGGVFVRNVRTPAKRSKVKRLAVKPEKRRKRRGGKLSMPAESGGNRLGTTVLHSANAKRDISKPREKSTWRRGTWGRRTKEKN